MEEYSRLVILYFLSAGIVAFLAYALNRLFAEATVLRKGIDQGQREITELKQAIARLEKATEGGFGKLAREIQTVEEGLRVSLDQQVGRLRWDVERLERTLEAKVDDRSAGRTLVANPGGGAQAERDDTWIAETWTRISMTLPVGDALATLCGELQAQVRETVDLSKASQHSQPVVLLVLNGNEEGRVLMLPILQKGLSMYPEGFFATEGSVQTVRRVLLPARLKLAGTGEAAAMIDAVRWGGIPVKTAFTIEQKGNVSE